MNLIIDKLIPAIFLEFRKKFINKFNKIHHNIYHPFEFVPRDIQAKWILDIGANIGNTALAALKTFPESKVICFEPVNDTFKTLQKKLQRYNKRVFIHNLALSNRDGEAIINLTNSHGANSLEPQVKFHKLLNPHIREISREKIITSKLDNFINSFPTNYIDIMKIDVEGHELCVLEGGKKFIKKMVDTIIIEIAFQRDESWESQNYLDIFIFLQNAGFRLINIFDIYNSNKIVCDNNFMISQMDCVFRNIRNLN